MQVSRRRFRVASGLFAGLLVLSAAASGADDVLAESGASGTDQPAGWAGELVVAGSEGTSLDPAKVPSEAGGDLDRPGAIFDTLLIQRADGSYEGQLAESMESADGITWTIKLRPDVTFTDGTPYDADAVIFNLERQRDPANAFAGAGNLADVASMSALDDLTVEIVLNNPNGTFWEGFASYNGMIGSPTAIEADPAGFADNPIGAGPYVLAERVRDSYTTLELNPEYLGPTPPAYQTIRVQMYPDPVTRAAALETGEVELAYSGGQGTIVQLGDLESKGLQLRSANGVSFVLFNHSRGPAQDVRVREAVSIAFDPARVNDAVLGGVWDELELVCPPFDATSPRCVPGLWPQYDLDRAKELIAEYAGEGNSVDVDLIASSNAQADVEFIQQTLNSIGLNAEVRVLPTAEWLPAVNAGEFDMSWYAAAAPVEPRLFYHFRSDQRNIIKADIPAFDEAVLEARQALDPADQQAAWETVQEILSTEFLVGYYAPFLDGYIYGEDIDLGDTFATIWVHLSEVRPA